MSCNSWTCQIVWTEEEIETAEPETSSRQPRLESHFASSFMMDSHHRHAWMTASAISVSSTVFASNVVRRKHVNILPITDIIWRSHERWRSRGETNWEIKPQVHFWSLFFSLWMQFCSFEWCSSHTGQGRISYLLFFSAALLEYLVT